MTIHTSKVLVLLATTALAGSLMSSPAAAATTNGTLSVNATVQAGCTVTAANLDFGIYSGNEIAQTSDITLVCTNNATASIALDAGLHATSPNDITTRKLANSDSSNLLSYNVFQNSTHTSPFGHTNGTDTADNVSVTAGATGKVVTAYGIMPANAGTLIAGTYTDSISVTVTY